MDKSETFNSLLGEHVNKVVFELGETFTWMNPEHVNQKGWELNHEIRQKIADRTIGKFIIALKEETVKSNGGLGGIEVIFNSRNNGFCVDYQSFPWYWDTKTETGGYTSYRDLVNGRYAFIEAGIIYLLYDITMHPNYCGFVAEMSSSDWGQISIQYGIGMRYLPFINAYLCKS